MRNKVSILNPENEKIIEFRKKVKDSSEKVFLTLEDVASILGIRYITVYRMVRAGKIRAGRHGGQWRIYVDDILKYHNEVCKLAEEKRKK